MQPTSHPPTSDRWWGEHELHALAEPAVVMAHGLGVHSPQLGATVAVTELVLTLFKLFARARSSLEETKLGVILLVEVTGNWVCTNILSGHTENGVEARGKLMTVLLSDQFYCYCNQRCGAI